ncbi:hypothetical protein [Xenorhabdus szentirmaii]|uniref:hypothetical protein n=1 Tax=Xenorhabdus szentirmaii TaxID=290112 RepID=UPI002B404F7D|nr:hypothetical protein [Xenorhabdus sp. 42]
MVMLQFLATTKGNYSPQALFFIMNVNSGDPECKRYSCPLTPRLSTLPCTL